MKLISFIRVHGFIFKYFNNNFITKIVMVVPIILVKLVVMICYDGYRPECLSHHTVCPH